MKTIKEILTAAIEEAEKTHNITISYIDVNREVIAIEKETLILQLSLEAK